MTQIKSLILLGALLASLASINQSGITNSLLMVNFDNVEVSPKLKEWLGDTSAMKIGELELTQHKQFIIELGNILYEKDLEPLVYQNLLDQLRELKLALPTFSIFGSQFEQMVTFYDAQVGSPEHQRIEALNNLNTDVCQQHAETMVQIVECLDTANLAEDFVLDLSEGRQLEKTQLLYFISFATLYADGAFGESLDVDEDMFTRVHERIIDYAKECYIKTPLSEETEVSQFYFVEIFNHYTKLNLEIYDYVPWAHYRDAVPVLKYIDENLLAIPNAETVFPLIMTSLIRKVLFMDAQMSYYQEITDISTAFFSKLHEGLERRSLENEDFAFAIYPQGGDKNILDLYQEALKIRKQKANTDWTKI